MNTYYIDYSTSGSSKALAVAINDDPPVLISCSLLEFVSGTGKTYSSQGQNTFLPQQSNMFPEDEGQGKRDPGDGQSQFRPLSSEETGKENSVSGNFYSSPRSGDILVVETNFEPHSPEEKNAVIDYCQEHGIELKTLPLRTTGKIKRVLDRAAGVDVADFEHEYLDEMREWVNEQGLVAYEHDDMRAVEAIRWCYKDGQATAHPKKASWHDKTLLQKFQAVRTGGGLSNGKHPWIQEMMTMVPTWVNNTDRDIADVYYQDSEWQRELVLLTLIAIRETNNRDEFDRYLGLYGHGYPRNTRASFIRRAVTLAKRDCAEEDCGDLVPAWMFERRLEPEGQREILKNRMNQVKRATRKFRAWVLEEGAK